MCSIKEIVDRANGTWVPLRHVRRAGAHGGHVCKRFLKMVKDSPALIAFGSSFHHQVTTNKTVWTVITLSQCQTMYLGGTPWLRRDHKPVWLSSSGRVQAQKSLCVQALVTPIWFRRPWVWRLMSSGVTCKPFRLIEDQMHSHILNHLLDFHYIWWQAQPEGHTSNTNTRDHTSVRLRLQSCSCKGCSAQRALEQASEESEIYIEGEDDTLEFKDNREINSQNEIAFEDDRPIPHVHLCLDV